MLKSVWNAFLVGLGVRPCCDKQKLKSNSDLPEYYEYECESCGHVYRGGNFTSHL